MLCQKKVKYILLHSKALDFYLQSTAFAQQFSTSLQAQSINPSILPGTGRHLTRKRGSKNIASDTGESMLAYTTLHLIYTYITLIKWIPPSTRVIRKEKNAK